MAKVKFKYSIKDKKTGWYTKTRTKTITMDIPVNEYGFVIHSKLSSKIYEYIASQISEPFHLLTYSFD